MGVTIRCPKTWNSIDMGYGGFGRLRNKIAELIGGEFAEHYMLLSKPEVMCLFGKCRETFFESYNKKTMPIIRKENVNIKVADFLYQSDCEGKIRYGACKELLKVIGDYDDDIIYGYCGRSDGAKFSDFVSILKDCVENKCDMIWR